MARKPTVHVNLRLPPELHRALVDWAAAHERSLNQSIIDLLMMLSEQEQEAKKVQAIPLTEREELNNALTDIFNKFKWAERFGLTAPGGKK